MGEENSNNEKKDSEMSKEDLKAATAGFFLIVAIGTLFFLGLIGLEEFLSRRYGNKSDNPRFKNKTETRSSSWENPWDDSRWQDNKVPWLEHTQGYPWFYKKNTPLMWGFFCLFGFLEILWFFKFSMKAGFTPAFHIIPHRILNICGF